MEISGLGSSMPFLFRQNEKEIGTVSSSSIIDRVDLQKHELLADDEVDGVLADTIAMIGNNGAAALSVHQGLSESRVFSLLGM